MLYSIQKAVSHVTSFIFKQFCEIGRSIPIVIPNLLMSETEALRGYVSYPRAHRN